MLFRDTITGNAVDLDRYMNINQAMQILINMIDKGCVDCVDCTNCTVSTMRTAAQALGLTYEKTWGGKCDIYSMGEYSTKSAKKLYDLVDPVIQQRGNRDILRSARSAKFRLPMFRVEEV